MTPEQQRIKIAEACGWTNCCEEEAGLLGVPPKHLKSLAWPYRASLGCGLAPLPDYPNDLNAMHEAEKIIRSTPDLELSYCSKLFDITGCVTFATAPQRAEAFLRTFNLWKE